MAQTTTINTLRDSETCCCCKCSYCVGTKHPNADDSGEKGDDEVLHIKPQWEQRDQFDHCCTQLCRTARSLWLSVGHGDDSPGTMKHVEQLYSHVWSRRRRVGETNNNFSSSSCSSSSPSKRIRLDETQFDPQQSKDSASIDCCPDQTHLAGEKLALIYLQSGRASEADKILEGLGYKCRLARSILDYTSETTLETWNGSGTETAIPCCIYDDFLSPMELNLLRTVFSDPSTSYWTDHNYTVEPPSAYFSYLLPLPQQSQQDSPQNKEGLQQIVCRLRDFLAQRHATQFPNVDRAEHVELWAHNRPHATGHQFHFDSDNEGCADDADSNTNSSVLIRNPICSCVLFLSGADETVGGPSVVTNQRLASRHLATKAWMCPAKANRLLAFDGKVLHGVVPGKALEIFESSKHASLRRVTVMLAFWRRIRVRNHPCPGAARLLPTEPQWARQLRASLSKDNASGETSTSPVAKQPIQVHTVYESVPAGNPWKRNQGMPDYEQMFQGF